MQLSKTFQVISLPVNQQKVDSIYFTMNKKMFIKNDASLAGSEMSWN